MQINHSCPVFEPGSSIEILQGVITVSIDHNISLSLDITDIEYLEAIGLKSGVDFDEWRKYRKAYIFNDNNYWAKSNSLTCLRNNYIDYHNEPEEPVEFFYIGYSPSFSNSKNAKIIVKDWLDNIECNISSIEYRFKHFSDKEDSDLTIEHNKIIFVNESYALTINNFEEMLSCIKEYLTKYYASTIENLDKQDIFATKFDYIQKLYQQKDDIMALNDKKDLSFKDIENLLAKYFGEESIKDIND